MGCKVSKMDEGHGKLFMKEAVSARDAFAAALSRYAITLKHTGAALSDYTEVIAPPPTAGGLSSPPPPPPPPPLESPILPTSSPSPMTMGPLPRARFRSNSERVKKNSADEDEASANQAGPAPPENIEGNASSSNEVEEADSFTEEEPDQYEVSNFDNADQKDFAHLTSETDHQSLRFDDDNSSEVEFKTEKQFSSDHVDMSKIMSDVYDQFRKASESVNKVSRLMNEANKMNNHSNFADNQPLMYIDYSAIVKNIITWSNNGDDKDKNEYETHAGVLDKLLVWEKKLYEDVKAFKPVQIEYNRKVSELNKLKLENRVSVDNTESLEKAKADVSRLLPRYTIEKQFLESTLSEMKKVRDRQLYPQLVALVHKMTTMWESMLTRHDNQMIIVARGLKSLDIAGADDPVETSKNHRDQTRKLLRVVEEWHSDLDRLARSQKQYIHCLISWLKQNLVPKEKVIPPIQTLLQKWHDDLARLPHEVPKSAIMSFTANLRVILDLQEKEMELKEKCEETIKEYEAFLRKDNNQKTGEETEPQELGAVYEQRVMDEDNNQDHGAVSEQKPHEHGAVSVRKPREVGVDRLKKKMEDEKENHRKMCLQVRKECQGSLKNGLPELFRVMSGYAHECVRVCWSLRLLTESLDQN